MGRSNDRRASGSDGLSPWRPAATQPTNEPAGLRADSSTAAEDSGSDGCEPPDAPPSRAVRELTIRPVLRTNRDERGVSFAWPASLTVVTARTGARTKRRSTREWIERIAAGGRGRKLRSQVASWHPDVTRDELDEAFQQACLLAGEHCRGENEGEVFTWLRTTTSR